METKMVAKMIAERIYRMYGSGTGVLFGLSPEKRRTVESIVEIALELYESEFAREIKRKNEGGGEIWVGEKR